MYVITGGAGFIGSNLAGGLEDRGENILIVDWLDSENKFQNIAKRKPVDVVPPEELFQSLAHHCGNIKGIIHLGAISSTVEKDISLLNETNFELPVELWKWCTKNDTPFVYASSAAVYGDGKCGFYDSLDAFSMNALRPLNPYGQSKLRFDKWVCQKVQNDNGTPPHWAGLRFFNVYGPNEYHKKNQSSMVWQLFNQISARSPARLFASNHPDYSDGEQKRDFIGVDDCVDIICWLIDTPTANGIFNVGIGSSRSFLDLAHAVFGALNRVANIEFIPMPEEIEPAYQYCTRANIHRLRAAGFRDHLTSLEDGVARYIREFLMTGDPYR